MASLHQTRRGGDPAFTEHLYPSPRSLLYELLGSGLIRPDEWDHVKTNERQRLAQVDDVEALLTRLVDLQLLTPYQSTRISTGNMFGLILGNFRILERLGSGGMAVVYKAEHLEMAHLVAIKVLQMKRDDDPRLETRFSAEMRAIARLRHPNIVAAMDAGRAYSPDPDGPALWYLVMEYIPGQDLHEYVSSRGPLSVQRACNLIHQVASALVETHNLNLVHRDIKPANILVTPEDQAKLLDFGLSRHISTRLTQPGTVLGTIDFMAPEQARDSSTVDIRADIYGLGGTLYWCLTGRLPFESRSSELEMLLRRLSQEPPSLRNALPDAPPALDALVRRMMALRPENRFATPRELMHALLPFVRTGSPDPVPTTRFVPQEAESRCALKDHGNHILIIDDEPSIRLYCREVLKGDGTTISEAEDGDTGLALAERLKPDMVLCDINMPGLPGLEVLRLLRESPPSANLKVIMISGQAGADEMAEVLLAGADDYLSKPFSARQLLARTKATLRLKAAEDRSDVLGLQLAEANSRLSRSHAANEADIGKVRSALVMVMSQLVHLREVDRTRLQRVRRYCRRLAEEAAKLPAYTELLDTGYIDMLECCAPLHDAGKAVLPDYLLMKPGQFTPDERALMQAHAPAGADAMTLLGDDFPGGHAFLTMSRDIMRHHHERFDGNGYPDELAGSAIPLSARIVAIADVYDALRCRRPHKPALSHHAAIQILLTGSPGQFDPDLLKALVACSDDFEEIFQELKE